MRIKLPSMLGWDEAVVNALEFFVDDDDDDDDDEDPPPPLECLLFVLDLLLDLDSPSLG